MPQHTHTKVEEWRDIPGHEGAYEVSSFGRIKSLGRVIVRSNGAPMTIKGKFLKPVLNPRGYLQVSLSKEKRSVYLHRLVCSAFHGEPREGQHARHLNGDPVDNRPENLAWGSQSDNMRDMSVHERTSTTKLTANQVVEIKRRLGAGETQVSIARSFGVVPSTIGWIKRGSTWQHT